MARRKKKVEEKHSEVFLPGEREAVLGIAMRGASDDEMAAAFGINPDLIQRWKEFYPSFAQTIEKGRSMADVNVVKALYEKAIGYSHPETKIKWDDEGPPRTFDVVKRHPPSDRAIEIWLGNRQKEYWKFQQQHKISGDKEAPLDIGVRDETKQELMSSILSLIKPKPDGDE